MVKFSLISSRYLVNLFSLRTTTSLTSRALCRKTRLVETVLRFGNIKFNAEDGCLNFSFMIQSTPDASINEEDTGLQEHAGAILESILETAAQEGQLQLGDPDSEE